MPGSDNTTIAFRTRFKLYLTKETLENVIMTGKSSSKNLITEFRRGKKRN